MAYLGIDIGTSGCKAAVIDRHGAVGASASRGYSFISPRPGWAEMDPDAIWQAVLEVLTELAPNAGAVRAIAVASIGESMVMTDNDDTILYNAINYIDSRCRNAVELINPVISTRDLYVRTGMPMNQMYSLNKLLWFRENMPEVLDKTRKIYLYADYFSYKLSGRRLVDPASASRTMLMDLRTLDWADDLMRKFGFDRGLFSPIASSGTFLGTLLPEVAAATGLSRDIRVFLAGHDQPCGTLGSGAIRAGDCFLSEGTSEGLNLIVDKEHITDAFLENNVTLEPFFEGRYLAAQGQATHGASIRWFADMFRRDLEDAREDGTENLYAVADRVCAENSEGVYFLPYLSGVDPNDAENNAKGCFIGLDVTADFRRMYRAVLEGLSFETRLRLALLLRGGMPLKGVTAAGGAAKSSLFMQMKADVLGRTIHVLESGEAGILGLGMICAVALGDCASYEAAARRFARVSGEFRPERDYSEQYGRYKKVNAAIRTLYRKL